MSDRGSGVIGVGRTTMRVAANAYGRLRLRFGPRRFQVFGVGPGKSGTHSLVAVFRPHFRASHEAEAEQVIRLLVDFRNGEATETDLRRYLRDRDHRLRLELDSAGMNAFLAPLIVEEFPEAKFILTVRDCFSWANSAINQLINVPTPQPHWLEWRDTVFGERSASGFQKQERILLEKGVWPLERFFSAWSDMYARALEAIPTDRLYIVNVDEIGRRLDSIADFVGVPVTKLNHGRAVAYQTPHDHELLSRLDRDFVSELARYHCGTLMQRFYDDRPCAVDEFIHGSTQDRPVPAI